MKDSRAIKIRITSLASIIFKDLGFSRKVCWYIRRRIANEGVAFVTRVLPTVSKHMLSCIEMGQWCPIPFEELKISPLPVTGPERYTAIFADELKSIFTDDQDAPLNLWRIRQAAEYLYKLALPFSVQQLDLAAEKFLTTDLSVSYDHEFAEQVRVSAERLFSTTQKLILDDVVKAARNGPGTYSGYQSCAFSNSLQEQKDILDGVVPARLNAFASAFRCRRTSLNHFTVHNEWKLQTFSNLIKHPNFWLRWSLMGSPSLMLVPTQITRSLKTPLRSFSYWMQGKLRWYTSEKNRKSRRTLEKSRRSQSEIYRALRSNDESTSEVLFVPKDSRGPRTIVREPYFNLRLQMGLHDLIRDSFAHDTRGRIQFISQENFRSIAHESSVHRRFCTIDLKDASDRVGTGVISRVFRNFPAIQGSIKHFRTRLASLPGQDAPIPLRKLSGMGSGFTFPLMAALIYTAIYTGTPLSSRDRIRDLIYVYGDDIIIPTWLYNHAVLALEKVGLQVNPSKCFFRSHFRESCGADAYKGQSVAPARLKLDDTNIVAKGDLITSDPAGAEPVILKLERHCRELIGQGLIKTASFFYKIIEQWLGKPLPVGTGETPYLCRWQVLSHGDDDTIVEAYKPTPVNAQTEEFGYDRALRSHLSSIGEDTFGFESSAFFGLDAQPHKVRLWKAMVPMLLLT
jgi:hypothetical protein